MVPRAREPGVDLGPSDCTEFAFTDADQNDQDDAAFMDAISSGRIDAEQR